MKKPTIAPIQEPEMKDGILLEHWDVIQDEATEEQSKSGNPMFGDSFPQSALSGDKIRSDSSSNL